MGKYIVGLVAILVIVGGAIFAGYMAGITAQGGIICEMTEGAQGEQNICVIDGVTYVPEAGARK